MITFLSGILSGFWIFPDFSQILWFQWLWPELIVYFSKKIWYFFYPDFIRFPDFFPHFSKSSKFFSNFEISMFLTIFLHRIEGFSYQIWYDNFLIWNFIRCLDFQDFLDFSGFFPIFFKLKFLFDIKVYSAHEVGL